MVTIKCNNGTCVNKCRCYRYMCKPDTVQAVMYFEPKVNILLKFKCEHYIYNKDQGHDDVYTNIKHKL